MTPVIATYTLSRHKFGTPVALLQARFANATQADIKDRGLCG